MRVQIPPSASTPGISAWGFVYALTLGSSPVGDLAPLHTRLRMLSILCHASLGSGTEVIAVNAAVLHVLWPERPTPPISSAKFATPPAKREGMLRPTA